MNDETTLSEMETFYMALADKTRLRLLNLMREDEICVCFFTEILGVSQPKVSRHLAYLRNAGIVEARRDGKWMHYSIRWPRETQAERVLIETLNWLADRDLPRRDRKEYETICCSPEALAQIAKSHVPNISVRADTNVIGTDPQFRAAHNELDEFLL